MIDIKGKVRSLERTFTLVYCGGKKSKIVKTCHAMGFNIIF